MHSIHSQQISPAIQTASFWQAQTEPHQCGYLMQHQELCCILHQLLLSLKVLTLEHTIIPRGNQYQFLLILDHKNHQSTPTRLAILRKQWTGGATECYRLPRRKKLQRSICASQYNDAAPPPNTALLPRVSEKEISSNQHESLQALCNNWGR